MRLLFTCSSATSEFRAWVARPPQNLRPCAPPVRVRILREVRCRAPPRVEEAAANGEVHANVQNSAEDGTRQWWRSSRRRCRRRLIQTTTSLATTVSLGKPTSCHHHMHRLKRKEIGRCGSLRWRALGCHWNEKQHLIGVAVYNYNSHCVPQKKAPTMKHWKYHADGARMASCVHKSSPVLGSMQYPHRLTNRQFAHLRCASGD